MVKLDTGLTDSALLARAAAAGVMFVSAAPCYLKHAPGGEFLFGFAGLNERAIAEGVRRLGELVAR
jgi:DNA-binding transcriptional MocR family regulator